MGVQVYCLLLQMEEELELGPGLVLAQVKAPELDQVLALV
jgi:hypothetical protein